MDFFSGGLIVGLLIGLVITGICSTKSFTSGRKEERKDAAKAGVGQWRCNPFNDVPYWEYFTESDWIEKLTKKN